MLEYPPPKKSKLGGKRSFYFTVFRGDTVSNDKEGMAISKCYITGTESWAML